MADDDLDMGDGDLGGGSPKKSGGLGPLISGVLKWVAIGVGAIILIVTVVVITMNIMSSNTRAVSPVPVSSEYVGTREILDWYSSIGQIRTKTIDQTPASVIVEVSLGYKTGAKATSTEITARQIEIKEFLRRFFSEKTIVELKPQNEDKLRIEIRNAINDTILSSSKIRDVRFTGYEVIEQ